MSGSKPNFVALGNNEPHYGCPTGKLGWRSKSLAKRAQKRALRNGRSTISVYDCPLCPWWHTTSQEQRVRS